MDKQLRQLETFNARGSDGQLYSVRAYEHLARIEGLVGGQDQWEPMGLVEYRLADGRRVEVAAGDRMTVADSGVQLAR